MSQELLDDEMDEFGFDDEFDPLEVNDEEINQEEMDDDNPYDIVDMPTMRNDPAELLAKEAVYTPERQGGAQQAMLSLFDHNPGRQPVFLRIIDACRYGCATSLLKDVVAEAQSFNRSIYSAMTLARMLERAGGLWVEVPEIAAEHEVVEEGVAYLEIKERVDPIWYATDDALEVYQQLTSGVQFRDIVFRRDDKYYDVYFAVLELINAEPRSLKDVENLVDTFEVVHKPRRFGGHFIDMLERTDGIVWKNNAWTITDLGRDMLMEMREAKEAGSRVAYTVEAEAVADAVAKEGE